MSLMTSQLHRFWCFFTAGSWENDTKNHAAVTLLRTFVNSKAISRKRTAQIWFIDCQQPSINTHMVCDTFFIPSLILLDSLQSKNSVSGTFWKKPFVLLPILSFRKVFCYFFREAVKGSRGGFFATITHTTIRVGECIIFAPVFLLSSFFLSSRL